MNSLKEPLTGIIPPLITPLAGQNTLDSNGLERLVEHVLLGGVHGLFILGTTGEGPGQSYNLRYELTRLVCTQVNKRVPVLVGITDTSITESWHLAEKAAIYGADAVVAAPPYYFATNQPELVHYFQLLAEESPLPLFLYNMPSHTKVRFEPETVRILAGHPNIVGFKDSSGNLIYFQKIVQILKEKTDFSILAGPEEMLMQSVLSGGHGGVNGGANMFPRLYVAMYEAATQRNFERMTILQQTILQISSVIYNVGDSPASYLQGLKCSLSLMGICKDVMAAPYQAFDEDKRRIIDKSLKELNVEEVL